MDRDGSDVDTEHLRLFLTEHLDERVVDTTILEVGLNRIIRIVTADDPQAYVVRQPIKDRDDHGFTDITTEHVVMERLEPTDVPVPRAVYLCEDKSVLGGPFSVIEYLEGEGIHWDEPLPDGYRSERFRIKVGNQLIDTLADLHSVDTGRFADICERVPPRVQVDQTVAQLEAATSTTGHDPETLWQVADWLQNNAPNRTATALVHGDYKPDNIFFTWTDTARVNGVVDWETVKLRDPRTELGNFLFYWREHKDSSPTLDKLAARHSDSVMTDIWEREERGFWPFTKRQGSLSRQELVSRWESATGLTYEDDRFYRALGAFLLASVWEGLYADTIESEGDTTGWEANVEYIAELADAIANGDIPL